MVNEKASKWVLGIAIYFFILTFIFIVVGNISEEFNLEGQEYINSSGGISSILVQANTCETPRFYSLNLDYSNNQDSHLGYQFLWSNGYIGDGEDCTFFDGASWEKKSFLGIEWGDEICQGNINLTAYNDDTFFENTRFGGRLLAFGTEKSVCDLSELQNDDFLCESFGCLYVTESNLEFVEEIGTARKSLKGFTSVLKTVWDIVTLKVNFTTGQSSINGILTFILIWCPIIALLLSIYELFRG
jgi:hypothetical protein